MVVKIKREASKDRKKDERIYTCSHVSVLEQESGLVMELSPSGIKLHLPLDGDAIYVSNDRGDTIDSYRWPPKPKTAELRMTATGGAKS